MREVPEPLPGRDVGDVRRPRQVRAIGAEVALDQVGRHAQPREADGGAPALARHHPGDTGRLHQPLHALSPDADAMLQAQLGVDAPRAVGAVRSGVDLLDLLDQPRVGQRPVRRRATLPVVEAGAVHPQRAAHHRHREVRPLRLDQREDLSDGSPVSRAKKAAAFLRISRSIRNVWFSRRNRASSSRSSVLSPSGRLPSSRSACLTHYLDFRIIWTSVVLVMSVAGRGLWRVRIIRGCRERS